MTLVRCLLAFAVAFAAGPAVAVRLDPNGLGQALIYPYYTARVVDGNAWTTALSLTNTRAKPKAVKLRFREGRHGRVVMEANVYLGPNDMWTGAVISESDGAAHLISNDLSCIDPGGSRLQLGPFSTASFTGANDDGAGTGADRALEGYFEAIEMGTLAGASAAAVTVGDAGIPANCASVIGGGKTRTIEAPEGGLSGMAYLLNINSGLVTSYSAVALAELTQQPFYSDVGAAGTDYDSPQVTPLSIITLPASLSSGLTATEILVFGASSRAIFGSSPGGYLLRSAWSQGVDAVSAVLMASTLVNEYVLDAATRSNTDWIMTLPTARFYNVGPTAVAPFMQVFSAQGACETYFWAASNREQARIETTGIESPEEPPSSAPPAICWSTEALIWRDGQLNAPTGGWTTSSVVGSVNFHSNTATVVPTAFQNGFGDPVIRPGGPGLTSLPTSTAIDLATGDILPGAHHFAGLPVVGFAAWKYENGLLDCSGQVCKGNFGVAIAHRAIPQISRVAP